jgi:hypothetical protein
VEKRSTIQSRLHNFHSRMTDRLTTLPGAIQIKSSYSCKSTLALLDNERLESTQQLDILKKTVSLKFQKDHEGHI